MLNRYIVIGLMIAGVSLWIMFAMGIMPIQAPLVVNILQLCMIVYNYTASVLGDKHE